MILARQTLMNDTIYCFWCLRLVVTSYYYQYPLKHTYKNVKNMNEAFKILVGQRGVFLFTAVVELIIFGHHAICDYAIDNPIMLHIVKGER